MIQLRFNGVHVTISGLEVTTSDPSYKAFVASIVDRAFNGFLREYCPFPEGLAVERLQQLGTVEILVWEPPIEDLPEGAVW